MKQARKRTACSEKQKDQKELVSRGGRQAKQTSRAKLSQKESGGGERKETKNSKE